jgi:hypothetical protein
LRASPRFSIQKIRRGGGLNELAKEVQEKSLNAQGALKLDLIETCRPNDYKTLATEVAPVCAPPGLDDLRSNMLRCDPLILAPTARPWQRDEIRTLNAFDGR